MCDWHMRRAIWQLTPWSQLPRYIFESTIIVCTHRSTNMYSFEYKWCNYNSWVRISSRLRHRKIFHVRNLNFSIQESWVRLSTYLRHHKWLERLTHMHHRKFFYMTKCSSIPEHWVRLSSCLRHRRWLESLTHLHHRKFFYTRVLFNEKVESDSRVIANDCISRKYDSHFLKIWLV